ncbi:MAG: hypothetical protein ACI8UO_005968 [Verrucomicrobiales bacterium]|jgi:hypothetical protein
MPLACEFGPGKIYSIGVIEKVQDQYGIEGYCSVHREDAHSERHYDYRPRKAMDRKTKTIKDPRADRDG